MPFILIANNMKWRPKPFPKQFCGEIKFSKSNLENCNCRRSSKVPLLPDQMGISVVSLINISFAALSDRDVTRNIIMVV